MTKSETQLTLQKRLHHLLKMMRAHFDNEHPDPDQTEPCKYLDDVEEEILALFTQALTSLTGLACDKCRVRMEDKLNNGGTQHE